jgi:hypothetical protein
MFFVLQENEGREREILPEEECPLTPKEPHARISQRLDGDNPGGGIGPEEDFVLLKSKGCQLEASCLTNAE